jgi:hypothetical protein
MAGRKSRPRAPDGSYFNTDAVRIELTERARARLGDRVA